VNGVDAKARVSLPAVFRQVIDLRLSKEEVVEGRQRSIMIGKHPRLNCLQAFDSTHVAAVKQTTRERADIKAAAEGLFANDVYEDMVSRVLGRMHDVGYDGSGRMVLPAGLKAKVGIGDDAVFLGSGDIFRIWSPEGFRTEYADDPDLVEDMELALAGRKGGRG
jgi:MraZ protein